MVDVEQVAAVVPSHLLEERLHVVLDDEVLSFVEERLHRSGRTLREARPQQQPDVLAREVGVLLAARERELLLHDLS